MHFDLPSFHWAFLNLQSWSIALIIPIFGMAIGLVFGGLGMYFDHQRRMLWHETARIALEKGQPIPPMHGEIAAGASAATSESNRTKRRRGQLTGGLINMGVGAGLYLALSHQAPDAAYFAAIPAFVGVALLLAAVLDTLLFRDR